MAKGRVNMSSNDLKNKVVSFTSNDVDNPSSFEEIALLNSKEKLSSIVSKLSSVLKNTRYFNILLGNDDFKSLEEGESITEMLCNLSISKQSSISKSAIGSEIIINDSAKSKLIRNIIYGKSIQSGTPSTDNPVGIVSTGDNGTIEEIVMSTTPNLYTGTKDFSGDAWVNTDVWTVEENGYNDFSVISYSGTGNGIGQTVAVEPGEIYTLSFYVKTDDDILVSITEENTNIENGEFVVGPSWARVSKQITVENVDSITVKISKVEESESKIYICGFKLEKGTFTSNLVPDWAPALSEITDDNISLYSDFIKKYSISTDMPLRGIPVNEGGNYTDSKGQQWICDTLEYDINTNSKMIQRVGVIESYTDESIATDFVSSTGELSVGAFVIYALESAVEYELTENQMSDFENITLFSPDVVLQSDCEIEIEYITKDAQIISSLLNGTKINNSDSSSSGDSDNPDDSTDPEKPVSTTIYAFHIDENESDPENKVTYLEDAVDMTPAYMDYTAGTFNYGSWENAFFMPRPCMVKYDGTVDYYLDETDYSKKEDGTSSDIANTSYGGNAMMEWGRDGKHIWIKVVADENSAKSGTVYIADTQVDENYHAYNFINNQGKLVSHFYTPIYNGSNISSVLRSLSGQTCLASATAETEITYAKANNKGSDVLWYTETYADRMLINLLLVLMAKSTDTQTAFGYGYANGNSGQISTGTMNTKGLFWGESTGKYGVKVFGMENYWGNMYRRTAGLIYKGGTGIQIKMTYGTEDGSTAAGYNLTGEGYITIADTVIASGNWIKNMKFTEHGLIPCELSSDATSSTYYTDYTYINNTADRINYAYVGGNWGGTLHCGAFYAALDYLASSASASIGASISLKPLA